MGDDYHNHHKHWHDKEELTREDLLEKKEWLEEKLKWVEEELEKKK